MVNTGRQEIVTNVSGALVGARTCHHGHMPEIEITGDCQRAASGRCSTTSSGTSRDGTRVGLQGYGHYREEYTREDGEWRIARTRLERLRVDWLGAALEAP